MRLQALHPYRCEPLVVLPLREYASGVSATALPWFVQFASGHEATIASGRFQGTDCPFARPILTDLRAGIPKFAQLGIRQ